MKPHSEAKSKTSLIIIFMSDPDRVSHPTLVIERVTQNEEWECRASNGQDKPLTKAIHLRVFGEQFSRHRICLFILTKGDASILRFMIENIYCQGFAIQCFENLVSPKSVSQ